MKITRRHFSGLMLAAISAVGLGFTGCDSLASYVAVAIAAFNNVLTLLGTVMTLSPGLQTIVGLIKAGLADLAGAVAEWENAPASEKKTLLDKVLLAIRAVLDNFSAFVQSLAGSGPINAVISLALQLVQVIITTLAGYLQKLTPAGAASPAAQQRPTSIVVMRPGRPYRMDTSPLYRTKREFVRDFNAVAASGGHPEAKVR